MKCVLIGNYGVGNIGDEALCEYFLHTFPEVSWTVIRHDYLAYAATACVPRLPFGFRSLFSPWWKTILALYRADAVIFGGGSLFTDVESVMACALWWWHGLVARLLGKPLLLAFQGVGPFQTRLGQSLARFTFEKATYISVRDEQSLKRLSSWNLKTSPVLSFDPAFARFAEQKRSPEGKRLVVIPRTNSDEEFFRAVNSALSGNFFDVRILLLQPSPKEREVGERLRTLCGVSSSVIEIESVSQLLEEVSQASQVVSQRYHGALAAFAMGIPVKIVPQREGDKLSALLSSMLVTEDFKNRCLEKISTAEDMLRKKIHCEH